MSYYNECQDLNNNFSQCQHTIDPKDLRVRGAGTGYESEFYKLKNELNQIHSNMIELVDTTKKVPGKIIYLAIHKLTKTNKITVRWRRGGYQGKHVSWDEFNLIIKDFQLELRQWYETINSIAIEYNQMAHEIRPRYLSLRRRLQIDDN